MVQRKEETNMLPRDLEKDQQDVPNLTRTRGAEIQASKGPRRTCTDHSRAFLRLQDPGRRDSAGTDKALTQA